MSELNMQKEYRKELAELKRREAGMKKAHRFFVCKLTREFKVEARKFDRVISNFDRETSRQKRALLMGLESIQKRRAILEGRLS